MSFENELRGMLRDVVREVVREELGARPTDLQNELLTYEQAGELVSVSPSTIKRWVSKGKLAAVGKGKLRRVRGVDVQKCFEGDSEATAPDINASVTSILASLPGRKR